ncbi:hypothetical protein M2138_001963 [Dysgonomonadaceae bacterium PH5-43]|nr:hypothetical protein [Dysgonomonadaceae bacterium PH5-43]
MDGLYLNNSKIVDSIQLWVNDVVSAEDKWKANNLHIDEIDSLKNIKRKDWVKTSFNLLDIIALQIKPIESLSLFLHVALGYSKSKLNLETISYSWLQKNIKTLTPPSFHYTSLEYYDDFYKKELTPCKVDKSISELSHFARLNFFYGNYFDELDNSYFWDIYIFLNNEKDLSKMN